MTQQPRWREATTWPVQTRNINKGPIKTQRRLGQLTVWELTFLLYCRPLHLPVYFLFTPSGEKTSSTQKCVWKGDKQKTRMLHRSLLFIWRLTSKKNKTKTSRDRPWQLGRIHIMTVSRYTQLKAQTVGLYCLLWRQCGQLKRTLGSIPEVKNNDLRSLCTTNICA